MSNIVTTTSTWTPDQIALVKRTVCKNATDDELKLFMHVAQRTGLDPFARQIYAVKRQNFNGEWVMTIQTGVDGFRLTAARSGAYAGSDDGIFEYNQHGNPTKCKVTVYRIVQGVRCSFSATAKWDEYYPGEKQGFMWRKLPETMLEKCAECKALRKAFPAELSSVYSPEEMDQAGTPNNGLGIAPEQPGPNDGNTDPMALGYRIPFGKYAQRPLEQVDIKELRDYVNYLERTAERKGQTIQGQVKEFIERAEAYIGAFENSPIEVEAETPEIR